MLAFALPSLAGVGKILVFLLMLSILVVLHEYGHFILARRNRVRVNDFAVGMGPTIFKWTSPRSGTNYRLNLFPIGGYCAMQGEDGKTNEAEQQRSFRESAAQTPAPEENFQAKNPWQRLAIIAAGPVSNFLVAVALLFAIGVGFGRPEATTTVGILRPNMPAQRAGILPGDRILSIDGRTMASGDALVDTIHHSAGRRLELVYERAGVRHTVAVTPVKQTVAGAKVGLIGFSARQETRRSGLIEGLVGSVQTFWVVLTMQFGMLASLVSAPAQTFSGLSGPIGIAAVSGQVQDLGWGPYLFLAAQLSISLGIFNLLPIPALDGGRAMFIVAELFRGRPVDPEKEAIVHFAGFAMLMLLMVFVAYNDIVRLVAGKGTL